MSGHLPPLAALLMALISLTFEAQARAACTAANPNANVVESTPSSAFTDNGNGTVTHALTGLMWKQCAQGQSGATCATGAAATLTWSAALAAAKNENFASHRDWRLPNRKELESIVESCGSSPAMNQILFPATPPVRFWSASSYVPDPTGAWVVDFIDGAGYSDPKSSSYNVRLVRGGQLHDAFDAQVIFANGFE